MQIDDRRTQSLREKSVHVIGAQPILHPAGARLRIVNGLLRLDSPPHRRRSTRADLCGEWSLRTSPLANQAFAIQSMAPGVATNRFSARITVPKSQGNSQAMLYATGIKDEAQMQLPQVGISSVWWEGNPCTS